MKRFIHLTCCITITCLLLACSDDSSSGRNPLSMIEQSSSENVFLSSSSDENDDSSSSESIVLSSSVIESSSSIKHQVEGNSSDGIVDSSSSESMVSSSSVIECSSSEKHQVESSSSDGIDGSSSSESISSSSSVIECSSSEKHQVESSSSDGIDGSSSSESIVLSSSVMESSSSDMIVGKCKTSTEDKCVYGELYDMRDGKTYKTVFMGTQEWMAENLNYSDSVASPNLQGGSWCYNNDDSKCDKYGRLYRWTAAIDTSESDCVGKCSDIKTVNRQGICPHGWHLPDTSDFSKLFTYVKKYSPRNYGYDLLAITETNGTDAFGFSLLYAGVAGNINLSNPTSFVALGSSTNLWTSVPDGTNSSNVAYFLRDVVYITFDYRSSGNSIRCVKD